MTSSIPAATANVSGGSKARAANGILGVLFKANALLHASPASPSTAELAKAGLGRFLLESEAGARESLIDGLSHCYWNELRQICDADAESLIKSVDQYSVATPLIGDLKAMLQCASHDENSCSSHLFCIWDSNYCRTSEGLETFYSVKLVAQEVVHTCSWFGATILGGICPAQNSTQCSQAGCSTDPEVGRLVSNGSDCAASVCGDSQRTFVERICNHIPGYDIDNILACYNLQTAQEFYACLQRECPELSSSVEFLSELNSRFDEQDRCSQITSEVDCIADTSCWVDPTHGLCKHHLPSYANYLSQTCNLAAWADLDIQCRQATTAEACVTFGQTCLWNLEQECLLPGPPTSFGSCLVRPELLGLYLRSADVPLSPAMDLISKAIISAHNCADRDVISCASEDSSKVPVGTVSSDLFWLILGLVCVSLCFLFCAAYLVWRRMKTRLEQQNQEVHSDSVQQHGAIGHSKVEGDIIEDLKIRLEQQKQEVRSDAEHEHRAIERTNAEGDIIEDSNCPSFEESSVIFSALGVKDPVTIIGRGIMEHWFIKPVDLAVHSVVGKGGYGEVRRGTLFGSTEVAVKFPCKGKVHKLVKADPALLNEIRLLRRVRHPNIVLFHGVSVIDMDGDKSLCIVLEWVSGGHLGQFLRKQKAVEDEVWSASVVKLLQDGARGLAYLHAQDPPIMHRDLKPANILIENHEPPLAKLADFGLSLFEAGQEKVKAGTTSFMAPEIMSGKHYGLPADVYSFGRVLGYVSEMRIESAAEAWSLSFNLQVLFEQCISGDPSSRPLVYRIYSELMAEESFSKLGVSVSDSTTYTPKRFSL